MSKKLSFLNDKPKKWKTFFYCFWGAVTLGFVAAVLTLFFISMGWIGYMPPIEELMNPHNHRASEVISADGVEMGRFYRGAGNRVSVEYRDISINVVNALVATEDARFLEHSGVDFQGLARAIFFMGKKGGGSTLTQQLAKQLYSSGDNIAHSIWERAMQKPIEWVIAVKLEHYYTKEDIIAMYLNQFDFLYNAIGIKSAAEVYFSTTPDKLTVEQAAMLVGMCKNPSIYNPVRRPEKALERRNVVFDQMVKANFLTQAEAESLKAQPIELKFKVVTHKDGIAPYFREYVRTMMTAPKPERSNYADWQGQKYHDDSLSWAENPLYGWCAKNKKPDGTNYDIYSDGLRIYTTIDTRMQAYAEESMEEHLKYLQKHFNNEKRGNPNGPFTGRLKKEEVDRLIQKSIKQSDRYLGMKREGHSEKEIEEAFNTPIDMQVFTYDGGVRDTTMSPRDSIIYYKYFVRSGFMAVDPYTGHVKSYVGGRNFKYFQYDMASVGRRQIGSTAKPYLYSLAMQEGMWPCDQIQCLTQLGNWHIHGGGAGMMALENGLAGSVNTCAAGLIACFTPEALVKMMRAFGLQSYLNCDPTLALGTCDVSVSEMVTGYTCFPNKGIRVSPIYVTRIEDADGNVIASFRPRTFEVMSELASYKMIHMMRGVITRGTGRRMSAYYNGPLAAKTGTTQNNSDGWFMCYSPQIVCGCWVGWEDRACHFNYTGIGQGASMALPISGGFLKRLYADKRLGFKADRPFDIPQDFDPNEGCKRNDMALLQ